jgi:UDP-glucose:(heptosyl)LPS alpha-1,3-glucosyltransferase
VFVGEVDDPLPYYAAADVYVHPTYYDPCSLVVLEALACGLPVVTTSYNGAGELIDNGVSGFVIDEPTNLAAMTDCIRRLGDSGVRKRMARAARQRTEAHSLEANFRGILDVYREVLARRGDAAATGENRAA